MCMCVHVCVGVHMCAMCVCVCVMNVCVIQTAGEASIANLDRLYHTSDGETHTAELRLKMQKVITYNFTCSVTLFEDGMGYC